MFKNVRLADYLKAKYQNLYIKSLKTTSLSKSLIFFPYSFCRESRPIDSAFLVYFSNSKCEKNIVNEFFKSFLKLLKSFSPEYLLMTTPYFNPPSFLLDFFKKSPFKCMIITASIFSNGFYNSYGFARFVPYFYNVIIENASKVFPDNVNCFLFNLKHSVFHAKEIFAKKGSTMISLLGSSNFGTIIDILIF